MLLSEPVVLVQLEKEQQPAVIWMELDQHVLTVRFRSAMQITHVAILEGEWNMFQTPSRPPDPGVWMGSVLVIGEGVKRFAAWSLSQPPNTSLPMRIP